MPDNKKIRHPQDGDRIDINDQQEVRNWCKSLGVTEKELKNAVGQVGTYAKDVKGYLDN